MGRKLHPVTCLDLVQYPLQEREFLLVSKCDRQAMGIQNPLHFLLRWKVFQTAFFEARSKGHSFVLLKLPHSTLVFITQHFYDAEPEMDHSEAVNLITYYEHHKIFVLRQLATQYLDTNPMDIHQTVAMWRLGFKEKSVRAKNYASRHMREIRDTSEEHDAALGEAMSHLEAQELRSLVNELWLSSPIVD
ncbi:hypothetical protein B0I72DRAFT_135486, partial [Yarrowia lipolytica]